MEEGAEEKGSLIFSVCSCLPLQETLRAILSILGFGSSIQESSSSSSSSSSEHKDDCDEPIASHDSSTREEEQGEDDPPSTEKEDVEVEDSGRIRVSRGPKKPPIDSGRGSQHN